MMRADKRRLSRFALLRDLFNGFLHGPPAIVARDTFAQLTREVVDLKRKLGLRVTVKDLANVLAALHGIESSRRYVQGYESIYAHLRARLSPAAVARLGRDTFFPPSDALIELAKSFEVGRLPQTVAFLEQATRNASSPAEARDLRAQWERAMAEDGAGAYEHFARSAWLLIYSVAFKMPRGFLRGALASIPHVESYLQATGDPGLRYYDVLAGAPKLLRVMVYFADANRENHALQGAYIPFPRATSEYSEHALDGYLKTVLGEAASRHVLFSANRERVEHEDPLDVQDALNRALRAAAN
jgi:hypothetical protein